VRQHLQVGSVHDRPWLHVRRCWSHLVPPRRSGLVKVVVNLRDRRGMRSLLCLPLLLASCSSNPPATPGDDDDSADASPPPSAGLFASRATHELPVAPSSIVAADLDGDGDLDLGVAASSDADGIGALVLLRNDAGVFTSLATLEIQQQATWLAAGDLDADGDVDLVSSAFDGQGPLALIAFRNAGDGTFTRAPVADPAEYAGPIAAGDVDADGDADLVAILANEDFEPTGVELVLGPDLARRHLETPAQRSWHQPLALADLDADDKLDLVTSAGVQRGDGAAGFGDAAPLGLDAAVDSLAAADLDGDGNLDVAATTADARLLMAAGDGDASLGAFAERPVAGLAIDGALATGDVDGDAVADLIVGGADALAVVRATGGAPAREDVGGRVVLAADVDGDGRADVVAGGAAAEVTILRTRD
jgi:hypothetical protein